MCDHDGNDTSGDGDGVGNGRQSGDKTQERKPGHGLTFNARVDRVAQSLRLDLADAFAGDVELPADFFQRFVGVAKCSSVCRCSSRATAWRTEAGSASISPR
jgi:hypothetical protein